MKRLLAILIMMAIPPAMLFSQKVVNRTLNRGDSLPNVTLQLINYEKDKASLQDFKGRLLILDFWSTWCTTCISQFPHLEALQKEFSDKLQILLVTSYQTKKFNESFFERRKNSGREIKLPSVVEDSVLFKLFKVSGLPKEVWVDENGVVIAITDHYAVTAKNIQRIIDKKNVVFPEYTINENFDKQQPLLVNNNGGPDSSFIYRSLLTRYNPSLHNSISNLSVSNTKYTRIVRPNTTIISLIHDAYTKYYKERCAAFEYDPLRKRILVQLNNSSQYKLDWDNAIREMSEQEQFKQNNLFCYEIILPPSFSLIQAYGIMLQDIEHFFKLHATIEKRNVKCLALVRTSDKDKLQTSGSTQKEELSEDFKYIHETNYPIQELINVFNNSFSIPYVIDGTGYQKNVDLALLISDPKNLTSIRTSLKKYDLDLIEKEYSLDMLVISSRD